jgi:hypothetical protein
MISKQKKLVEKPKKSAPKKKVNKVNKVNVDKIVKIIKRLITKCGMKNKKKGGGLKDMFNRLRGKNNDSKTEDYGGECMINLKNIDSVFGNIRDDVKSARDNLIDNLKFFIEETTTKNIPNIKTSLEDILKNGFDLQDPKLYKTFDNLFDELNKQLGNFPTLWNDIKSDDSQRIISTFMIISALEITYTLYLFRDKMIECVRFEIDGNSTGDDKQKKLKDFEDYIKGTDNIYAEKETLISL